MGHVFNLANMVRMAQFSCRYFISVSILNDSFTLKQNGEGWNIIINDQVLMNHSGIAYSLPEYSANILRSYQQQSNGIVPEGKYLLFGELIEGSYDSTKAGFFAREVIIAKVLSK